MTTLPLPIALLGIALVVVSLATISGTDAGNDWTVARSVVGGFLVFAAWFFVIALPICLGALVRSQRHQEGEARVE